MLESVFNTAAAACNFIEKSLQHRFFPVDIATFLRIIIYRTPPVAASQLTGLYMAVTLVVNEIKFKFSD